MVVTTTTHKQEGKRSMPLIRQDNLFDMHELVEMEPTQFQRHFLDVGTGSAASHLRQEERTGARRENSFKVP